MTKKKKGSGKTRTLNTEENRLLLLRLGKTHMNKVAAACGVSDDVIMRMRDRSGTFRLSTIAKVLKGLKGFEKKSVATQPSVPAINGWPRDFTSILASFENAGGSAQVRSARARPEDVKRFYSYHRGILAREADRAKDEDTRSRVLNEILEIRSDYSAYLKGERAKPAVDHPEHYGGKDNPYEAIKVIEAWDRNFNLGNAAKYISRAGKKGCSKEDLEKAVWYLKRELERRSS